MYKIDFKPSVKKDFKNIDKSDVLFIRNNLRDFIKNFSPEYETTLMGNGKIKKLKGQKEVIYRLKLRSYRVIYKKYEDRLVILVVH
ncbi:MAG: hypothetical protein U9Q40_08815, partial [Campylobacterota bacterium]|nr:hypothetical protein [Campylobacterota bacterium]